MTKTTYLNDTLDRLRKASRYHPREFFGKEEWKTPVEKDDLRLVIKILEDYRAVLKEHLK
jgi:hypothetical protein